MNNQLQQYLSDVKPYYKKSGRRTSNVGLIRGKNRNVTFEIRNKFPGIKINHENNFVVVTKNQVVDGCDVVLTHGAFRYSYLQGKKYWEVSRSINYTNNLLTMTQALVCLMNTDSSLSWKERIEKACELTKNYKVRGVLGLAYWDLFQKESKEERISFYNHRSVHFLFPCNFSFDK